MPHEQHHGSTNLTAGWKCFHQSDACHIESADLFSVGTCLLWQNASLELLKAGIACLAKQRNGPPPPEGRAGPLLSGLAFPACPKGEGMRVNADSCTWWGVELASQPAPQSGALTRLRFPATARAGQESLPQSSRGLQGRGAAPHCSGEKQGEGTAVIPTAAGHRREERMVLLALLTSCGQKTLLAPQSGLLLNAGFCLGHVHLRAGQACETRGSAAPAAVSCPSLPCTGWVGREAPSSPRRRRPSPGVALGFAARLFSGGNQIPLQLGVGRALPGGTVPRAAAGGGPRARCRVLSTPERNLRVCGTMAAAGAAARFRRTSAASDGLISSCRKNKAEQDVPGKDPETLRSPRDAGKAGGLQNGKGALPSPR